MIYFRDENLFCIFNKDLKKRKKIVLPVYCLELLDLSMIRFGDTKIELMVNNGHLIEMVLEDNDIVQKIKEEIQVNLEI